jgi:small subunit ribosomal protein S1
MEVNGNEAHEEPSEMEQLLQGEYDYQLPKRGDVKKGIIISINPNQMIVDVGLKKEGIVPASDFSKLGPDVLSKLAVGDEVTVSIERPSDREGDMIVSLYRTWMEEDWKTAQEYLEQGRMWEGEVTGYNKGGLIVPFGKLRGFVPSSQLPGSPRAKPPEDKRMDQLKGFVGQKLPVKVIEVDRNRRRLILSARAAEREWRAQMKDHIFSELKEGEIRHGVVSSLCDFGAFVDLGGVEGLVHVSELSWQRVRHPKEVLKVGEEVNAYVLRVDKERQRVGLSIKKLLPEPWAGVNERYTVNQLVQATITNLVDFGAFARIDAGVEGLIHVSELSDTPVTHPSEVVKVGDVVTVKILRIDAEHRRLGLSLKGTKEEEFDWAPIADDDGDDIDAEADIGDDEPLLAAPEEPQSED